MSQCEDRISAVHAGDSFDQPPPTYIEATLTGLKSDSTVLRDNPLQDSLEQLVRRLPAQLRTARQDQFDQQQDNERLIAERSTPYIAGFLRDLPTFILNAQHYRRPLSAELILIPANAVPATEGWVMSGLDQRKEDAAHVQVVEVDLSEDKKLDFPDQKHPGTLDEALGGALEDVVWWRKEDLARRLASRIRLYLDPKGDSGPKPRTSTEIKVDRGLQQRKVEGNSRHEARKHRSPASLFSGHAKEAHGTPSRGDSGSQSYGENPDGVISDEREAVEVNVQTEEVTFRRENDMGLWESSSGWAIVLIVTVAP